MCRLVGDGGWAGSRFQLCQDNSVLLANIQNSVARTDHKMVVRQGACLRLQNVSAGCRAQVGSLGGSTTRSG